MSRFWLAGLVLIAALGLTLPAAMADHGHGKGKHQNKHFDKDHDRWEAREGYEYRSYDDGRPEGWSRGKKTGWKNCGLPPGQAKKYGCRVYVHEGRPHYYYEDEHGRIFVRRPMIQVHGSVDIVR
jgi:hypothetical protein